MTRHKSGPNKIGIVATGKMPEVDLRIPSVETAQKALDELEEVPYQAPDAPKKMQDARREYLRKKEILQARLDMAKNMEASRWKKVG